MEAIVENLVKAGYFRARINTLSDFDKIIGAIAWALQFFSYDIDINIFYADTLDLGQKIALTERLVMVLIAMKCPYPIEPHQIVGMDYANLLPVIDWLIKRSAEARREHAAFNRLLALRHFHRVTNSTPTRQDWCHVISPTEYSKLREGSSSNLDQHSSHSTTVADDNILESSNLHILAKESFQDPSKHVSFVQLSSLFNAKKCGFESQQTEAGDELEGDSDDNTEILSKIPAGDQDDDGSATDPPDNSLTGVGECRTVEPEQEAKLHEELDTELLATNQKILNLIKRLDSVPSKMEIEQYQRRYIELHQQLISKNKDLKKIYALFNSLDSTKHYLTKEINLLDSILANLSKANSSARNRELFLVQFNDIVLKIIGVRDGVTTRLEMMRRKRNELKEEYRALLQDPELMD